MAVEQYIPIGKLGKPHALSGAFRFYLSRELKSTKKLPPYFVTNLKGSYQPWFIKSIEWTGFNEGIILFEEITTPEKARQHTGAELCLPEKDLNKYFKKDAGSFDYLAGYKALDDSNTEIGIIEEIVENPGQVLLAINRHGKEVMVPFVDDFVISLNKRKKEIVLSLPEGLIESQL